MDQYRAGIRLLYPVLPCDQGVGSHPLPAVINIFALGPIIN